MVMYLETRETTLIQNCCQNSFTQSAIWLLIIQQLIFRKHFLIFTMKKFSNFHDGGPYQIETSPLMFTANQKTWFYMIWTSTMKELKQCKFIVKGTNQAYYKFLNAFMI